MKLSKLFSSSANIFLSLSIVFLSLSLFPVFYEIFTSYNILPGRIFLLEHNFLPDYNSYLSKILQGIQGNWLVYERLTSEPHHPSLLQIFYLLLGKIGGLFTNNPVIVYLISRLVFGFLRLYTGWLFISLCFKKKLYRLFAFILFAFSAGFPWLKTINEKTVIDLYLSGWSHLETMRKLTFIPHWLAGHTLISLSLYLYLKNIPKISFSKALLIGILGLILGLTLPSGLFLLYLILSFYLIFKILTTTLLKQKPLLLKTFLIFLTSLPSLLYIKYITTQPPWHSLVIDDARNRFDFPFLLYFKALGPTFYLGLAAVPIVICSSFRKKINPPLLIASFYLLSLLSSLYFIDLFIHTNHGRFVQLNITLPLAVLTVFTLKTLSKIFPKYKSLTFPSLFILILIPSFVSNYVSIKKQIQFIKDRQSASIPDIPTLPHVIYPTSQWFNAITWFKNNTSVADRVFSGETAGSYIPAYSGNHVFYGHGSQTYQYDQKTKIVIDFYKGSLTKNQIKNLFKKHQIKYVFYGPQEKGWGSAVENYNFLQPVYNTPTTTIYKVKF